MYKKLLYLNGLAIFSVIIFHAVGWGFTAMFFWAHRYSSINSPTLADVNLLNYYVFRVIEQLVVFTIPAFLFVSGFFVAFVAGRDGKNLTWKVVGARITALLIPYLLWANLVFLVLKQANVDSVWDYFRIILTGSVNPSYYFIPLLIQFYLLSPLIVPLARKWWKGLLLVTGLFQLLIIAMQYLSVLSLPVPILNIQPDLIPKWFFPARIFWFCAGVVIGFHLPAFKAWLARYRQVILAVLFITIPLGIIEWEFLFQRSGQRWVDPRETLIDALYAVAVLLCLIAFDKLPLPMNRTLSDLGSKSFGIYIVHAPVMEGVSRVIYHLFPALLSNTPLLVIILIVSGLGIPLAAMSLVNISPARRIYAYLFS